MAGDIYCAIDIGGTKTLFCLLDRDRNIYFKRRLPTPAGKEVEVLVDTVNRGINRGLEETGLATENLTGIGICIAALTNFQQGIVYQAPNLGWTQPVALKDYFRKTWGCPLYIENDANAAVLGEVYYGAARGHRHVIYITISTGIGGGLFLDGQLYRGAGGFAGEIGHTKSYGEGRTCGCGGSDCLEAWASGRGIARSAGRRGEDGWDTARIFARAARGDHRARELVDQAVTDIATGVANLVTFLNPSCVVLGGSVAAANPFFFERVRDFVQNKAIRTAVMVTPLEIVPSVLEPEAGIWGIYAMMIHEIG